MEKIMNWSVYAKLSRIMEKMKHKWEKEASSLNSFISNNNTSLHHTTTWPNGLDSARSHYI